MRVLLADDRTQTQHKIRLLAGTDIRKPTVVNGTSMPAPL
jgi:hypothetical protein